MFTDPMAVFAFLAALVAVVVTGTSPWQLAAKRLWTGDLLTATAPRILVAPGDTVIPKGRNVIIEAEALGFSVGQMQLHALFDSGRDWEQKVSSFCRSLSERFAAFLRKILA